MEEKHWFCPIKDSGCVEANCVFWSDGYAMCYLAKASAEIPKELKEMLKEISHALKKK